MFHHWVKALFKLKAKFRCIKAYYYSLELLFIYRSVFFYQYKWRINKNVLLCLWFPVRAAYIHIMNHHLTLIPGVSVQFFKGHTMKSCSQLCIFACKAIQVIIYSPEWWMVYWRSNISQVSQTLFFLDFHLRFCIIF